MKNLIRLIFFSFLLHAKNAAAQTILPNISVKNSSNKIIISWKNDYHLPIATINIQRSFDSLKNYTTIGTVLNPQAIENGFGDNKPPYNRMYYRLFIAFEGGTYVFSNISRPEKNKYYPIDIVKSNDTLKNESKVDNTFIYSDDEQKLYRDSAGVKVLINKPKTDVGKIQPKTNIPEIKTPKIITYPSNRIFTAKNNVVVIDLPDADIKKYSIRFYTETDEFLFELNKIPSKYLIIEKVNFERSGWYNFEIFENGVSIEKNKFFVPKDSKKNQKP
ncbi:MAG: hypothetical protein KA319_12370 [Ferruginibacter sp.]|nr:hypothetical protein [Ferruginibacter sp.]